MVRGQKTWIAYGLISSAIVLWVGLGALHFRRDIERCAEGWSQGASRCCLPGQSEVGGRCQGTPSACLAPLKDGPSGCVAEAPLALIRAGTLVVGPSDWDAIASPTRRSIPIAAFQLDPFEVTHDRYASCVRAKVCAPHESDREVSRPVTRLSAEAAATFCEFVGGRLPTVDEWMFAASDGGQLRYPWGPHGLTCRRAAFGLEKGPCATSATGPELVGSRPSGARQGLFDLAGNVKEWARQGRADFVALGGSFRSVLPSELKSWGSISNTSRTKSDADAASDDIGFRCAYDENFRGRGPRPRVPAPPSRKPSP